MYDLQQGCMSAIMEGISASEDGWWTAVGQGNGPFVCSRLIRMVISLIRNLYATMCILSIIHSELSRR